MHHSLQIMVILPLKAGHLFWKATILGGLYRGVPLYIKIGCDSGLAHCRWQIVSEATMTKCHEALTLNMQGLSYLSLTRSISWLLMPWLLHRQDISNHDIDYVK